MTPKPTEVDVLILGAGAAGLMCAIEAGRRGRRTLVLEHADRPGKPVLISGGGRCNFTNLHARPENFLSANPHFAKSALARYTSRDFIALVEKHGIPYHEKTLGQLFCDRSANDILNLLLAECAAVNAGIQFSTRILSVTHVRQPLPRRNLQRPHHRHVARRRHRRRFPSPRWARPPSATTSPVSSTTPSSKPAPPWSPSSSTRRTRTTGLRPRRYLHGSHRGIKILQ